MCIEFLRDEHGRALFHPYGIFGRAYVVDGALEAELRQLFRRGTTVSAASVLAGFLVALAGMLWHLPLLALMIGELLILGFLVGWYWRSVAPWTRRLRQVPERLTLEMSISASAARLHWLVLVLIVAFAMWFCVDHLADAIDGRGVLLVDAILTLAGAFVAAVYGYALWAKAARRGVAFREGTRPRAIPATRPLLYPLPSGTSPIIVEVTQFSPRNMEVVMPISSRSIMAGVLALLLGSVTFAQPQTVDYSGLGLEPGTRGGTLTLALGAAPPSFLYYADLGSDSKLLIQHMFDSLVEFDLETYELVPALAASWDISEDGTVYTFHLREGVTWHDGEPFTAEDVVFTYNEIIRNPEARAGDVAQFVFTVDGEEREVEITAPDDMTVQMVLPAPSAAFLLQQRFPIMPKHKLLEFTVEGGAAASEINNAWQTDVDPSEVVGTGAFMLRDWVPGQLAVLERNPNYWKVDTAGTQLPYLDGLEYLVVTGTEAQTAQFLAGNLDQLNISGAQFPDFKSREVAGADFRVIASEALFGSPPHLAFNFDVANPALSELFADHEFRRAMEFAVDRERIIEDVYNGLAQIPGTPTAPADGTFYEDTTGLLNMYDLEAANAALDALGLEDTDGNGIRNTPAGPDLEFTLKYGVDSQTYTDIATIIQNDFEQVGVRANLQGVQSSTLLGTGLAGDYEAIIVALGNQPDPELRKPIWQPGGALYYWHRSTQPAEAGGEPNWDEMADWERRIWEIFDRGTVEINQEERVALYKEWQRLNAEYAPVIMIAKPQNIAAAYNRVQNFVYSLGVIPGYNPVPLYFVEQ
jgi:peptide/nickel transport system substrate-binding protein